MAALGLNDRLIDGNMEYIKEKNIIFILLNFYKKMRHVNKTMRGREEDTFGLLGSWGQGSKGKSNGQ